MQLKAVVKISMIQSDKLDKVLKLLDSVHEAIESQDQKGATYQLEDAINILDGNVARVIL